MRTMQQQFREKGLTDSLETPETFLVNKTSKHPKERLSRKEWEEIMGMNRETYQKQGGAYLRK